MTSKVYTKQIGGAHYKKMKIQPSEFVHENKMLFAEGNIISIYVGTRIKMESRTY